MLTLKIPEGHWVDLMRSDIVVDLQLARVHVQKTYADRGCTLRIEGGLSTPPVGMASVDVDLQDGRQVVLRDPAGDTFCTIKFEAMGGHKAKLTFACDEAIKILRDDAKANHHAAAAMAGKGWRP